MMEAVLGIREERTYETPALKSAKERAKQYWKQAQKFGPIAIPPQEKAILNQEDHSVQKLFNMLATMALSGPSQFTRDDGGHGSLVVVEEPGGRRWDQRSMAIAAQLAPNTGRKALKRLQALGLIAYEAVRGRCTFVRVLGFQKFTRSRFWRGVLDRVPKQKKSVSTSDTFPPVPTFSRSLTSTVDVPSTESKAKKEGDTLEPELFLDEKGYRFVRIPS